jgi:TonB family protein
MPRALALLLAVAIPLAAIAQELEPPELLQFVDAEYPPAARAAGKEATVPLEILVGTNGTSDQVTVVAPQGDGFDEAAVAAARRFTWKPGRAGDQAVPVKLRFDYHFELPRAPADRPAETAAPAAPAGTAVLVGVARERGTRAPLPFAEVTVAAEGVSQTATADTQGGFRVAGLPGGRYRVTVAAAGHRRQSFDETLRDGEALEVKYALEPLSANPYRTIVEGERPREEVERRTATRAEATRIPGTRGDALRVVETFPGVARPVFGIGALLYHFGGITSVVNSDLLERIDFLPGNFSARYGRATGGVVFADLRAPRRDRWGGFADVSLLDASVLVEGPVGAGSLAIAARRSYVDAILNAVLPSDADIGFTTAPRYWDYQAIWDTPALGGRFTLTALGSDDKLELLLKNPAAADPAVRGTIGQTTYVQRLIATYRKAFSPDTSLYATIAQGVTKLNASAGEALFIDITQWFQSYRAEVEHRPAPWLKLSFGSEGQIYPFHVQARGQRPPAEGEIPSPTSVQQQLTQDIDDWELRAGVYAEAALRFGGLTVTPGVRADYYRLLRDFSVDPRLAASWELGDGRLHAGVGRYSETVPEFESDPVFGNPDLAPQHALHASLGYDRQVLPELRVESTVFYKWLGDLAVRSDALVMKPDGSLGPVGYVNDGAGRVFGLELLVRLGGAGPLTGWVSYTLSRAERKDRDDQPWRLFSFDQTHILTVVASARLPWRLTAGGRFRFVSGNPSTPVTGSIYDADADVYIPIPGATNSERVASYNQLDLRIERPFLFDSWKLTAYLEVQNVYNRKNPEAYNYSYDYRQREIISGLPIFPSFGVKGEF